MQVWPAQDPCKAEHKCGLPRTPARLNTHASKAEHLPYMCLGSGMLLTVQGCHVGTLVCTWNVSRGLVAPVCLQRCSACCARCSMLEQGGSPRMSGKGTNLGTGRWQEAMKPEGFCKLATIQTHQAGATDVLSHSQGSCQDCAFGKSANVRHTQKASPACNDVHGWLAAEHGGLTASAIPGSHRESVEIAHVVGERSSCYCKEAFRYFSIIGTTIRGLPGSTQGHENGAESQGRHDMARHTGS